VFQVCCVRVHLSLSLFLSVSCIYMYIFIGFTRMLGAFYVHAYKYMSLEWMRVNTLVYIYARVFLYTMYMSVVQIRLSAIIPVTCSCTCVRTCVCLCAWTCSCTCVRTCVCLCAWICRCIRIRKYMHQSLFWHMFRAYVFAYVHDMININMSTCVHVFAYVYDIKYDYGVASVSRIDKIIGLFCKRAL